MGEPIMLPIRLLKTEWPPNDGVRPGTPRFDDIFESVQREGIREPLTINLGWFVIDGNHRLSAARQLGMEWVPVRVWTGTEFLPAGDASESPPPEHDINCGIDPLHLGEDIGCTCYVRHEVRDASESGQPPREHVTDDGPGH